LKNHKKVNIISLGCSKNLVDSEFLLKQLEYNGFEIHYDSNLNKCDIVIINTCGFIKDAKEESIDAILNYVQAKENGDIQKLYVMGCLSERYKNELSKEIPSVDKYFGVYQLKEIVEELTSPYIVDIDFKRIITTPSHYAYLKISEGCDRTCAFCAIPLIKGNHKSKSIEQLIKETEYLASKGVKELILIAQDLTYYGYDIYKKFKIVELINKLSNINGIEWIRLHYTYPLNFRKELISEIKQNPKVCNYIDIPVQHISDNILKRMRRGVSNTSTLQLLDNIRTSMPNAAIRTTLLVGFPGETKKDFEQLTNFVSDFKFDRLGVFEYSNEEDTYAYKHFKDNVSLKLKNERANIIMEIQQSISKQLNMQKIGNTYKTIIDRKEGEYFIGRTEYDSPEVDNEILIKNTPNMPYGQKGLKIGNFYNIKINSAEDYDLFGEISKNKN